MKTHDNPSLTFALFVSHRFFREGLANQREQGAIDTGARLDHMRGETLFGFFVKVVKRLATGLLMLTQVVIGPISHAFQLLAPEGKIIFDVVSTFRIKG